MSEQDALSKFDFSKVTKGGLFLKWKPGVPVTLRVLTVDPVVSTSEYTNDDTGEVTLSTKFAFIVYNFTDKCAQILQTTGNIAKKIGELHVDPDFGADIRKIDIKITPTGEKLQRRYDIQVLPKANELTAEQIKQCASIKLDEKVEGGTRMSFYDPANIPSRDINVDLTGPEEPVAEPEEPFNLDDIPF